MGGTEQADISHDTLLGGRLHCRQHRHGYRFSIDALLLAAFCAPRPTDHILDLGAGCGVIGLLISHAHPSTSITFYELQPALCQLITANIRVNDLTERCRLLAGDVRTRQGLAAESMDYVLCNPPYGRLSSGRINPDSEQAIARHELRADLADFIQAAAFVVKNRGKVAFVYPARFLPRLLDGLARQRLTAKRLRLVHSYPGSTARLLLVEAVKNGGEELRVLPPLFIYLRRNGDYDPEVAAMLEYGAGGKYNKQ